MNTPSNNLFRDLFDKVWVLSLASSIERRQHISTHLPSVGINDFEFFDATPSNDPMIQAAFDRGEVATFPPCFRCGGIDCGNPDCNNFLIPEQVACFISYLRLWQTIADGSAERVLVVEDDVWIHPYASQVLEKVNEEIQRNSIPFSDKQNCLLRLGWARCADHDANTPYRIDTSIKMSNPCHALTRSYARALLDRYSGIRHTADVFLHQLAPLQDEAFTVYPPIASELSWTEGRFASTIHPKNVRVEYLRNQGDGASAVAEEQRIHIHVKKKHFRPLLITGHPRGGTGFAAALCCQMGLDVGHERLGAAGISSWMFAVEAENPYALDDVARTRRAFAWRHLIMPVRNLSQAVPSVMRDSQYAPPSYAFRREHIRRTLGTDLDAFPTPLERAIRSLTGWVRIILDQNPDFIFRIEDGHEQLREFLIECGLIGNEQRNTLLDTHPVNADKLYKGVRYPKPQLSVEDWQALSDSTLNEIAWYQDLFGYPLPDAILTNAAGTSDAR